MNKKVFSRTVLAASLAAVMATPAISHAGGMIKVTNGDDSGEGSLRAAIESGKSKIKIAKSVETINILSTLDYTGEKALTIKGSGQTVSAAGNFTLLAATNGADLTVSNLNFAGPGGFDVEHRGDIDEKGDPVPAGKGIFVDVRDDQTGTVKLVLKNVSVSGVANHGIHVSDCSLADDCGGGSGGGGEGSDASIKVILTGVEVNDAGNGKFDADGLRVDERGDGSITAYITASSFTYVGADGVELDEGNDGDVNTDIKFTDFSNNGNYCDPAVIGPFVPVPDEGEYDESEAIPESLIPSPPYGSADDNCIEREVDTYDSGFVEAFEFGIDLDDGIDIDEAGEGSLNSLMLMSTITGNLDEGVDYDEEDGGDINVKYIGTSASGNKDDGYKHSEEGEGGVFGKVTISSAMDNGGKGFVFEEEDEGDLAVRVVASKTANNDDSDDTGIEAVQEDEGKGTLKVRNSDIADGIDTDGVDEI